MSLLCFFGMIILIVLAFRILSAVNNLVENEKERFRLLAIRLASLEKKLSSGSPSDTSSASTKEPAPSATAPASSAAPASSDGPVETPPCTDSASVPPSSQTSSSPQVSPVPPAPEKKVVVHSFMMPSVFSSKKSAPASQAPQDYQDYQDYQAPQDYQDYQDYQAPQDYFTDDFNNKLRARTESIEERTRQVLSKIWQWFIVGEEYRDGMVSKEYAVATTWLLRSAFLMIVFGISFFIKYSHDKKLFSPELRLACASLFAIVLMAAGCRLLRGKYRMIGVALSGCGFSGLYLCIFAGVGIYHLMPPVIGLVCMFVLTIAGVLLALRHDTLLLAVFALLGGYLAPVLMNTGSRDLVGFFSYLLILTAGSLFIARYRTWTLLNILSFLASWILFFSAEPFREISVGDSASFHYLVGLLFGFAFFLAFSIQTVLFNLFTSRKITIFEIILTALNGIFFIVSVLPPTIALYGKSCSSILTVVIALYYLAQLALLQRSGMKDKVLMMTLLVFSCGLIGLTLPLLLNRNYWSAAWAIQAVSMLYIACRAQSRGLASLSYMVFCVAGFRLLAFDLSSGYFSGGMGFADRITNFGSYTLALIGGYFTLKHFPLPAPQSSASGTQSDASSPTVSMKVLFWGGFLVSFIIFYGEFSHLSSVPFRFFFLTLTTTVYLVLLPPLLALFHGTCKLGSGIIFGIAFILFWICTLGQFEVRFFEHCMPSPSFVLLRIAEYMLLTVILLFAGRFSLFRPPPNRRIEKLFLVSGLTFWFLYSSVELHMLSLEYGWQAGGRIAVSALWGVYAFLLLLFGIWKTRKEPRHIALILFAVMVVKIFLIDLAHAPALFRIGGCLIVGVILVAAAWIYMKSSRPSPGKSDSSVHKE